MTKATPDQAAIDAAYAIVNAEEERKRAVAAEEADAVRAARAADVAELRALVASDQFVFVRDGMLALRVKFIDDADVTYVATMLPRLEQFAARA